jgi:hypothetical protein
MRMATERLSADLYTGKINAACTLRPQLPVGALCYHKFKRYHYNFIVQIYTYEYIYIYTVH